ncbi:hypothetical protein RJT34_30529 [Clitoria ternatea]|uniref:Uncharacterized protein n=1 Tax=Clitoria ternatea TaxID=43366 RepID=A0AAN9ESZ8_CLITE
MDIDPHCCDKLLDKLLNSRTRKGEKNKRIKKEGQKGKWGQTIKEAAGTAYLRKKLVLAAFPFFFLTRKRKKESQDQHLHPTHPPPPPLLHSSN